MSVCFLLTLKGSLAIVPMRRQHEGSFAAVPFQLRYVLNVLPGQGRDAVDNASRSARRILREICSGVSCLEMSHLFWLCGSDLVGASCCLILCF